MAVSTLTSPLRSLIFEKTPGIWQFNSQETPYTKNRKTQATNRPFVLPPTHLPIPSITDPSLPRAKLSRFSLIRNASTITVRFALILPTKRKNHEDNETLKNVISAYLLTTTYAVIKVTPEVLIGLPALKHVTPLINAIKHWHQFAHILARFK